VRTFYFFFTLVTGPRRFLSLKLSDTRVYEPQIRARLGSTAHFCKVQTVPYMKGCALASKSDGKRRAAEDTLVSALTPNTVELIPTLGALFPRGGPVQDPVLTPGADYSQVNSRGSWY